MKDWLLLEPLKRFDDLALLLLRWATGVFLIYQSHDNVFSDARMGEFVGFLTQFGFIMPEVMAPLSVWFQFLAGFAFIIGLATRWFGLITAFQFVVATWMVHSPDPFNTWWPALALIFIGLVLGTIGAGRYSLDAFIARRRDTRGPVVG